MHWDWLGKADKLDLNYPDGRVAKDHDMWTYLAPARGRSLSARRRRLPHRAGSRQPGAACRADEHAGRDRGRPRVPGQALLHVCALCGGARRRARRPGRHDSDPDRRQGRCSSPMATLNDKYQADDWFADYYCATLSLSVRPLQGRAQASSRSGAMAASAPSRPTTCRSSTGSRRQCLDDRGFQSRLQNDRRRRIVGAPSRPAARCPMS